MRKLASVVTGMLLSGLATSYAYADPHKIDTDNGNGNVTLTAKAKQSTAGRPSSRTTSGRDQTATEFKARVAEYQTAWVAWQACVSSTGESMPSCTVPSLSLGPQPPGGLTLNPVVGGPLQIAVTPEEVAYMAIARLHLDPLTPVIGPPPDLNPWHMAAVGYPLWLSGAGTADPAPVTDAVFNLLVSLDAHVTQTDFAMGDGHVVTCRGAGVAWSNSVTPGEKSPTCGYQYSRPSLPDKSYTVIARTHWDIDWTINNQRGVIRMAQTSSTQLPVGELQVLIR